MGPEATTSARLDALTERRDDAFYRALVEGMNDGVLTRDAAGVITYASPRFRDMLGYSAGELVGSRSEFVLPPEQRGEWAQGLAAVVHGPPRVLGRQDALDGQRPVPERAEPGQVVPGY